MEGPGLSYNPDTGEFTRPTYKRKLAGCLRKDGYIVIRVKNVLYLAHRLAFFYMTGSWPKDQLDHINMNRSDNRWGNLREATNSQNMMNKNSRGVCSRVRKGRPGIWYTAYIEKDKKRYASTFRQEEKALLWRANKEKELFGNFRQEGI